MGGCCSDTGRVRDVELDGVDHQSISSENFSGLSCLGKVASSKQHVDFCFCELADGFETNATSGTCNEGDFLRSSHRIQ